MEGWGASPHYGGVVCISKIRQSTNSTLHEPARPLQQGLCISAYECLDGRPLGLLLVWLSVFGIIYRFDDDTFTQQLKDYCKHETPCKFGQYTY